jgi:hypothetical protein
MTNHEKQTTTTVKKFYLVLLLEVNLQRRLGSRDDTILMSAPGDVFSVRKSIRSLRMGFHRFLGALHFEISSRSLLIVF